MKFKVFAVSTKNPPPDYILSQLNPVNVTFLTVMVPYIASF